jgi:hypothetical protein
MNFKEFYLTENIGIEIYDLEYDIFGEHRKKSHLLYSEAEKIKKVLQEQGAKNMNFKEYFTEEMRYEEPAKSHFPEIFGKIREQLDVTGNPKWYRYIANRDEGHSKYHMFFVFKKGNDYIGGNSNGRISYPPMATHKIAQSKSYDNILNLVEQKYRTKLNSSGYKDVMDELDEKEMKEKQEYQTYLRLKRKYE